MDIAFATKEATRQMTAPATDDWNKLIRLGRYLARYPRVVNWYKYQNASKEVVACPAWAGAKERGGRRQVDASTDGTTCLSSGAKHRPSALSGAAVKASQEVLGMMSLWKDVGTCDGRRKCSNWDHPTHGVRKVRHLNTSWLWVQVKAASHELQNHKVSSDNSADLFTKALDHDRSDDTLNPWEANSRLGRINLHAIVKNLSAPLSMKKIGNRKGEEFRDKRKNTRGEE